MKRLARESEKEFKRQDREYTNLWNKIEKEQEREYRDNIKKKLDNFRKLTKDMEEQQKRYEKYQEYVMANKLKMERGLALSESTVLETTGVMAIEPEPAGGLTIFVPNVILVAPFI